MVKNDDNTLSATWQVDGAAADKVTFTNTYTKPTPGSLTIPVEKVITGDPRTEDVKQSFIFTLAAVTKDAPLPEKVTVDIRDAGSTSFGAIQFTQPGTYEYTLTETKGTATGYTYDTTERKIVVEVSKKADNTLNVTWKVDGNSASKVTFTNNYKATPISISGTKT